MVFVIRDVCDADLESVLELNQSELPQVGSVDLEQMRWFAGNAHYFRVAAAGGSIGAYLIGLRPGTSYASPNYRWFCDRYVDFGYVDRVAVARSARRARLATRLYEDFAARLPPDAPMLACEVNVRPPNPASLIFHERLGFEQVGTLVTARGSKEVAMLVKDLRQS